MKRFPDDPLALPTHLRYIFLLLFTCRQTSFWPA